jgi:hypothetical protein
MFTTFRGASSSAAPGPGTGMEAALSVVAAERGLAEKAAGNGTVAKESAGKMAGVPKGDADSKPAKPKPKGLLPFTVITICYLLFTVTDGAIRMIVLMHAYTAGFSAMQVAIMFTLYELAGVVTNLAAGLAGARWGIKCTLLTGLVLQLVSYGLLFGWQEDWPQAEAIIYVTVAQMFGGIAKDLTKLGGKTVTKLVTPEEKATSLFKLVSGLTGWKNSLKGVGYFVGSALIGVRYELALGVMIALIVIAMPIALAGLDPNIGTARKENAKWTDVFVTHNANLNWLSLARCFLFASRDFWFEVPLPFFLRSPACDGLGVAPCALDAQCGAGAFCSLTGTNVSELVGVCANSNVGGGCGGFGWERITVGAILGAYIIVYGQCQSYTPQLVIGPLRQTPPNKLTEVLWGLINCVPTAVMAAVAWAYSTASAADAANSSSAVVVWLMSTLVVFAVIFAINSSIHSFLVVHYAKAEKIATSVGFYYMSNAVGRLLGTLGSGVLYTYTGVDRGALAGTDALRGLAVCFIAGTISSLLAAVITLKIQDDAAGLRCGPCWVCIKPLVEPDPSTLEDAATTE